MAVFRINKTKDYTVMGNFHFTNYQMSWKAKGILSQMLSLPDDWEYTEEGLATLSSDGLKSLEAGLKELEEFGHLVRVKVRDERGVYTGVRYDIYEKPITEPFHPSSCFPLMDNPRMDKPLMDKGGQLNTKELSTKELSTNKGARFRKPSIDEVREYIEEIGATFSAEHFYDYYEANGWKVSKNPMKDWKATVRNWASRDKSRQQKIAVDTSERIYDQNELREKVNDPVRDILAKYQKGEIDLDEQ